jgi:hypothetical protein
MARASLGSVSPSNTLISVRRTCTPPPAEPLQDCCQLTGDDIVSLMRQASDIGQRQPVEHPHQRAAHLHTGNGKSVIRRSQDRVS